MVFIKKGNELNIEERDLKQNTKDRETNIDSNVTGKEGENPGVHEQI